MTTAAARIAARVHGMIAARGRTVPAGVVDASMLATMGFCWATTGTSSVKVLGRTRHLLLPGDTIFIRKMTHEKTSSWVYDGFGQHPNPDGTTRYQPVLGPNA